MVDAAKIEKLRGLLEDRREALSDLSRWPTYEHEAAHSLALDRLCIVVVEALPDLLDLASQTIASRTQAGEGVVELCQRLRLYSRAEDIMVSERRDLTEAANLIATLSSRVEEEKRAKEEAERERDQWRERESETQDALQAIGEEFGARGGEPRTDAMRRLLTEERARTAALARALEEAKEALKPFAVAVQTDASGLWIDGNLFGVRDHLRAARAILEPGHHG